MKERRSFRVTYVAAMLAVVIAVGGLLGGKSLENSAESIDSPGIRFVALSIARPLAAAGERLHLEEARQWVLSTFGDAGEEAMADVPTSTQTTSAPPTTSSATSTAAPSQPSPSTSTPVTAASPPSTTSSSTTSTTEVKPRITADRPLRVLVAGDSLVLQVGHGVTRLSEQLPLEVKVMSKPSSGLSRPDFYDWPGVLKTTVAEFKPDLTVLMFGNNDKQDVTVEGKRLARFSPDWWEMYRGRVQAFLGIPEAAGSKVVWVGMPIMRSAKFAETARSFNTVYSEVCEAAGATFVDSYKLFSGDGGGYTPYLPNAAGKQVLMRNSDGIHLTEAGGDLVAAQIATALRGYYDLE